MIALMQLFMRPTHDKQIAHAFESIRSPLSQFQTNVMLWSIQGAMTIVFHIPSSINCDAFRVIVGLFLEA